MTTTNAITTAKDRGTQQREFIEARKDKILRMLPSQVGQDRFMEIAASVVATPEIALCTPASVVNCVFACAKLGLVPDPVLNHIHIIPRSIKVAKDKWEKQATILVGYKGLIELGRRSGGIRSVNTEIVYMGDDFKYWIDEHGKHIRHVPNLDRDEGAAPIAVYCVAELSGGGTPQVEVMTWKQVGKIKKNHGGDSMPWKFSEDEMARKTVARRASKLWPQSAELSRAVNWDEQVERGEHQTLAEIDGENIPAFPSEGRRRSLIPPSENGNGHHETDPPTQPADSGGATSEAISLPSPQPAPSSPAAQAPAKTNGKPKKPEPQKIDDDPRSPEQAAEEYSQNVPVKELIDWLIALPAKDKEAAMTVARVRNLMGASDDDVRNVAFNARLVLETRKREGK